PLVRNRQGAVLSVGQSISLSRYVMSVSDGSSWAATDDGRSCGRACQAVSGERHTAALAKANLVPVQRLCARHSMAGMVPDGKSVAPAARRWSDRARDEHFAAIGPDLHAKLADVVATFVTARTRP